LRLVAKSVAFPDRAFPATVRTIGSRVDEATRTATVRAYIQNTDTLLRPGMLMSVILTVSERMAPVVPDTAVLRRSDDVYVYVVNTDNVASLRAIRPGVRFSNWIEILGGIQEGEQVVTSGVIKLRDGVKVRLSAAAKPELKEAKNRPSVVEG
jgi:membrane fusion protein (multidrug efflux system)